MSSQLVPVSTDPSPSNDVSSAQVVLDWRTVNAALLRIARGRGELDAEEAGWLVAAEQLHVHRHLGCVTLFEYLERVLGYGPRRAADPMRHDKALQDLPETRAALAKGHIPFTGVRELARVAVPATERVWLAAAGGETVPHVRTKVAGRAAG